MPCRAAADARAAANAAATPAMPPCYALAHLCRQRRKYMIVCSMAFAAAFALPPLLSADARRRVHMLPSPDTRQRHTPRL